VDGPRDEHGVLYLTGLPPEPWPDIPPGYVFGSEWAEPPAVYLFSEDQAMARQMGQFTADGLRQLLRRLGVLFVDGSGSWWMPVRFIRAQIHAQLGGSEELIHSICLRAKDDSADVDEGTLATVAGDLGDCIHRWFTSNAYLQSSRPVSSLFWDGLHYDEVRCSYMEQTQGTNKDGSGGNLETLTPTVRRAIPAGAVGGTAYPLPLEVALALTVTTDKIGPSVRGRTYLGGLCTSVMANDARFGPDVHDIGTAWGQEVIYWLHQNGNWAYNVFSSRHASAREAQGVYVGLVPDSQRRRRKSQDENRTLAWGTPAGLPVLPS
jgi:hypothetical protein